MTVRERISELYRRFGEVEAPGRSPFYVQVAARIAPTATGTTTGDAGLTRARRPFPSRRCSRADPDRARHFPSATKRWRGEPALTFCPWISTRWLEVLVWPGEGYRLPRLRAACEIARRYPPRLLRGDLRTDLRPLAEQAPADFHRARRSTLSTAVLRVPVPAATSTTKPARAHFSSSPKDHNGARAEQRMTDGAAAAQGNEARRG
jgi:hypothetical protein